MESNPKQLCSYTQEEIAEFRKNGKPLNDVWGMSYNGEVIYIPFDRIKEDHLINIIAHIKQYSWHFNKATLHLMENLYKERFLTNSDAGKILYVK